MFGHMYIQWDGTAQTHPPPGIIYVLHLRSLLERIVKVIKYLGYIVHTLLQVLVMSLCIRGGHIIHLLIIMNLAWATIIFVIEIIRITTYRVDYYT